MQKSISFTRKTDSAHFNYVLYDILIIRTDFVKHLGIILDRKLHLHRHVDYLIFRH
jgi:hypothetical protein